MAKIKWDDKTERRLNKHNADAALGDIKLGKFTNSLKSEEYLWRGTCILQGRGNYARYKLVLQHLGSGLSPLKWANVKIEMRKVKGKVSVLLSFGNKLIYDEEENALQEIQEVIQEARGVLLGLTADGK